MKLDLEFLKTFGSRVCVKRSGVRRAKLDRHDFTGIFLGYTATDRNIVYLDLDLGIVKHSHYATFDEAWYLQPARPSAAQLLYDLGLEAEEVDISLSDSSPIVVPSPVCPVPWPPLYTQNIKSAKWDVLPCSRMLPLPLRETALLRPIAAAAAHVRASVGPASTVASEFNITKDDMAIVYMSQDPFFNSFEEVLDLWEWSFDKHRTAGLFLVSRNGRLYLGGMTPSTPDAKVDCWHVNLRGAWLVKVGSCLISTILDAQKAFKDLYENDAPSVTLLFSHPELRRDISNKGLPILSSAPFSQQTHNQINRWWDFTLVAEYLRVAPSYDIVRSGDVLNYITDVMKLTRGKLRRQDDWSEWQTLEFLQLDQYDSRDMFGTPVAVESNEAIFNLVWSYGIKAVDARKKAQSTCNGSPRSGQVCVINKTYANCVDQTSARLFYGITAAENLTVYGSDVSNAFAEAPPPQQGFYHR